VTFKFVRFNASQSQHLGSITQGGFQKCITDLYPKTLNESGMDRDGPTRQLFVIGLIVCWHASRSCFNMFL